MIKEEQKKIFLGVVGGFVAGIAVTLLVCSLCCGSHKMMHKRHFMHGKPAVVMQQGQHDIHKEKFDKKHHEMKKHGKHAKKDGAFNKHGFKKKHHDKDFADGGKKFDKKSKFGKEGAHNRHLKPTPEMKAAFAEKLKLTDEQKVEIEKYRQEDMAKMKGLFDELERVRAEIKEARQAGRARFENVLTEEQKAVLDSLKK